MMSLEFYWGHFLRVESASIDGFLAMVQTAFPSFVLSMLLIFMVLEPLEFLLPWRKAQRKLRPQLWNDVFYTFFNTNFMWVLFGTAVLSTWILISQDALAHYFGIRRQDLLVVELDQVPMWARFVAMYMFSDLVEYLGHWASHQVPFLWHFHRVHHSSSELDIWNANRFHFVEFLWGGYVAFFAMALVGFPAEEIVWVAFLLGITNVYSHANINIPLGPLKYIFNNPQLHIWHHAASVDPRRNVNYGASLAVWDYLLGTAYLPKGRSAGKLGYHGDEEFPTGLGGQFLDPFVAIGGDIRNRFRRLRKAPP